MIVGLDLASADAPLDDTLLLGDASQIYASGDTLVLAHPAWQAEPLGDADTRTALHVFALPANGGALYRGSGFVPGTLLSQFAIDVRDDVLRVATSFTTGTAFTTVTRVTTTRIEDGALVTLGQTGDLGRGEQLQGFASSATGRTSSRSSASIRSSWSTWPIRRIRSCSARSSCPGSASTCTRSTPITC